MTGNFPNLSALIREQWQEASDDPLTRGWYPPYAVTFAAFSTVVLVARLCSQIKKSAIGIGIDDTIVCFGWVCVSSRHLASIILILNQVFAVLHTASSISGNSILPILAIIPYHIKLAGLY